MRKKSGKCIAFYAFTSKGKIRAVPCGLWSCEVCRKENARMWAWRTEIQIKGSDKTWYFWTLTLGSKYTSPKQGYLALKNLWDNLRKTIARKYSTDPDGNKKKWTYIAFVEAQPKKRKMPHFHIITDMPAPYRIKDFAVHMGFGYMAKMRVVDGNEGANYVSKYASKGDPEMPKNFRRVRSSQNWAKLPPYIGDKLYVKSRTESVTDFMVRVSDATGADIDDLWEQWQWAREMD